MKIKESHIYIAAGAIFWAASVWMCHLFFARPFSEEGVESAAAPVAMSLPALEALPGDRWALRQKLAQCSEQELAENAQKVLHDLENAPEPADPQARLLTEFIRAWAVRNPAAAAEFSLEFPSSIHSSVAQFATMQLWAESDLPSARAWLEQKMPEIDEEFAHALLAGLIQGVARGKPESALALMHEFATKLESGALKIKSGGDAALAYPMLAMQQTLWGDVAKFLNLVIKLPAGHCRDELLEATAMAWMEIDSRVILTAMVALPASEVRDRLIINATQQHLLISAEQAAKLYFSTGISNPETAEQIFDAWAEQDLPGFAAWINGAPSGPPLDLARSKLALAYAQWDPKVSSLWAAAIQDEALRAITQEKLIK